MTPALLPFQQQLVARLSNEESPDRVLVRAPSGSGMTSVLVETVVRSSRSSGGVLVVAGTRVLADQWASALRKAGVAHLADLRTTEKAVLKLDEPEVPAVVPDVLVSTLPVVTQGAGWRVASALSPGLLVIDHASPGLAMDSTRGARLRDLASLARRVVVLSGPADDVHWLAGAETIDVQPPQAVTRSTVSMQVVTYSISENELEVNTRAISLMREANWSLAGISASTRPALHGTLMRLATRLAGDVEPAADRDSSEDALSSDLEVLNAIRPELLDELWSSLDEVEALGEDRRLVALRRALDDSARKREAALVLANRVDEVRYVAGALADRGMSVAMISGGMSPETRGRKLSETSAGEILVATRASLQGFELAERKHQIWWSSPATYADAAMQIGRSRGDATIVALLSAPPLPGDQPLAGVLRQIEAELGIAITEVDG